MANVTSPTLAEFRDSLFTTPKCEFADPYHKDHKIGYSHDADYIAEIDWGHKEYTYIHFMCRETMGWFWDNARKELVVSERILKVVGAEALNHPFKGDPQTEWCHLCDQHPDHPTHRLPW